MDLRVDLTPILIVSVVFFTSAAIVATVLLFAHRARELRHATIRLALEKGQPLPPGLFERVRQLRTPGNDLNKGIKLVFLGLGLSLFFFFVRQDLWAIGLIPLFVGLGHLAAHALAGRAQPAPPPAG